MPTHETLLLFLKCLCSESDLPKKKKMKVINVYNDEIASFRGFRLTYGNNFADKSLFPKRIDSPPPPPPPPPRVRARRGEEDSLAKIFRQLTHVLEPKQCFKKIKNKKCQCNKRINMRQTKHIKYSFVVGMHLLYLPSVESATGWLKQLSNSISDFRK